MKIKQLLTEQRSKSKLKEYIDELFDTIEDSMAEAIGTIDEFRSNALDNVEYAISDEAIKYGNDKGKDIADKLRACRNELSALHKDIKKKA